MTGTNQHIDEQATAWVIRLRDGSAEDWEEFTFWLEADPAHGAAYEEAALADAELEALPPSRARPVLPAAAAAPGRHSRRTAIGWGLAAALVGAIGLTTLVGENSTYAIATGAGERRTVALADGSRVDVNGGTRMILDRANPRYARLEQGEALFTVVHDARNPFRVETGGARLTDLGTVFNVERAADGTIEVQVAEGLVRFEGGGERVDLDRGATLRKQANRRAELGSRSAEAITGWREGRLSYSNATVGEIADDLSRNIGIAVTADPAVAGRRFSGVIVLDRDPERMRRRVSALLEVQARQQGEGWLLSGGRGTP